MPEASSSSRVHVTFALGEVQVTAEAAPGATLLDVARDSGVLIAASCGGRGACGTCAVELLEGTLAPADAIEDAGLARARPGLRLACRARVSEPVTVRPVIPVPSTRAAVAPVGGAGAAGVDLGTTTIAARLVGAGGDRPGASVTNPQVGFGADVASRLAAARRGVWLELQAAAARGVEEALALACARSGCQGVERVVVAANTAMAHLLLGASVASLAVSPHEPAYDGLVRVSAGRFGSRLEAKMVVLPHLGQFVGGDVTAAAIALGLDEATGPALMIDIGTNAEIALSLDGRIVATSAAAGPAFEGAGIVCGGPAVDGAIVGVEREGEGLALRRLGEVEPMWLAGSAVVDTVVVLREVGHLDSDGRFLINGPMADRFHKRNDVLTFQVAGSSGEPGDVYLTQLDVRQLQLAKAAVAVAAGTLLSDHGLQWGDLHGLHVAGAFGAALRPAALAALGIIPASAVAAASSSGDAALEGAVLVAGDDALEERAERIASTASVVDLAKRADFRDRLMTALAFPVE